MKDMLISMGGRVENRRAEVHARILEVRDHPERANTVAELRMVAANQPLATILESVNYRFDKVLRTLVTPKNVGGEELRTWLDQFTLQGIGLDVCCGNFKVGKTSIGTDLADNVVGNSYNFAAEDLSFFPDNHFDYLTCNYADGLNNLGVALKEWHRVIKPGGVCAVVCSNAVCYNIRGDMLLKHRRSLYTQHTLAQYMNHTFNNSEIKTHLTSLMAVSKKKGITNGESVREISPGDV